MGILKASSPEQMQLFFNPPTTTTITKKESIAQVLEEIALTLPKKKCLKYTFVRSPWRLIILAIEFPTIIWEAQTNLIQFKHGSKSHMEIKTF